MKKRRNLFFAWLYSRRRVLVYVVVVFLLFFVVYGVYGYDWGVAMYAALLGAVAGLCFAAADFARFSSRHALLGTVSGRFPTELPPGAEDLLEKDYEEIIAALEAERRRLELENTHIRADAEEYYTLWAHQIKTPIAALKLLLQSRDALGQKDISAIAQELFRINQYVDMVLQYQRLSSLQNDLVLERFPVETLVKKAAKSCSTLFIHKKIALSVEDVRGSIVTDEKWFCFVLEQLYTNAVKYTAQGAVRVYSEDEETLVIEDSGIGIQPGDLPRVFERGFTGAIGRSERSSTGIGLYLCRTILERLGFAISISSTPGEGTKVSLHLAQQVHDLD